MAIPIPEFKVLLYGPGLPPAGKRARARFEGSVLTLIARRMMVMVAAQDISLTTGGFDGRQWVVSWVTQEGSYSALLQGEGALQAFIKLAPQEIGLQLQQSRKTQAHAGHRFHPGLTLLTLLLLLALGLLWVYADRLSLWVVSHISLEQERKPGNLASTQLRPSLNLLERGPPPAAVKSASD